MKEVVASVDIDAPAQRVWEILMDFDRYPDWNPFIRSIRGEAREGARLEVGLQPPGGRVHTFRPTVVKFEPGRDLRWLGRVGFAKVFDGRHSLRLEPLGDARSRFTQHERFSGVLLPFMGGAVRGARAGFEAMNHSLKRRAEGGP
jgi:hypothetical protein